MTNPALIQEIVDIADQKKLDHQPYNLPVGGLSLVRSRALTPIVPRLYAPIFCLVLQGRKTTSHGEQTVSFTAGETLIISMDLPGKSQIVEASAAKPYVALALEIDVDLLRELRLQMTLPSLVNEKDGGPETVVTAGRSRPELIEAMARLFRLSQAGESEKAMLAPLLVRECHIRMLLEPHGGMLRRLSEDQGHAGRIRRVLLHLKHAYAAPAQMSELAEIAGMSLSSFHDHFKKLTGDTPLQYKKNLRLLHAREKLRLGSASVSDIAYDVGYESLSQFSRDFSRKFGHPPSALGEW